MNTLSDTDESRARPSVWPVYLAIVAITLACGVIVPFVLVGGEYGWQKFPTLMAFGVASALLGLVAVGGLAMRRPWGWWCGVGWTSIFAAYVGWFAWVGLIAPTNSSEFMSAARFFFFWPFTYSWLGIPFLEFFPYDLPWWLLSWPGLLSTSISTIVVLTWVLVTRRRLFFPPKREGEEEPQNAQEGNR